MIATSDLVILLVSASALAGGLYKWQQNTHRLPLVGIANDSAQVTPVTERRSLETHSIGTYEISEFATTDGINPSSRIPGSASQSVVAKPVSTKATRVVIPDVQKPRNIVVENTPDTSVGVANSDAGKMDDALYGIHRVVYGDYLGKLAIRYGTTTKELRTINELTDSSILVGQEIRYPLPAN